MRGLDAVNEEVVQKAEHLRFALQFLKTLEERKEDFLHFRRYRVGYSLRHNFRRERSGVLYGVPVRLDEEVEKDRLVVGIGFL